MRIIAGEYRRRLLRSPPEGASTRPIPDRVKESLFMLLRGHCEGANVFDGFAGTGAIGLEAASRGAARVVMVERDRAVADVLRENVQTLGAKDRCEVFVGDALGAGALARAPRPLHLAFLDPPYQLMEDPAGFRRVMAQLAALVALLRDDGFAVLRTPWPLRHPAGDAPPAPPPADAAPEPARRRKGKDRWRARDAEVEGDEESRRGGHRRRPVASPKSEADEPDLATIADTEVDAAPGAGTAALAAARLPRVDADLRLPGVMGPETHAYHGMGVHLYMRARP